MVAAAHATARSTAGTHARRQTSCRPSTGRADRATTGAWPKPSFWPGREENSPVGSCQLATNPRSSAAGPWRPTRSRALVIIAASRSQYAWYCILFTGWTQVPSGSWYRGTEHRHDRCVERLLHDRLGKLDRRSGRRAACARRRPARNRWRARRRRRSRRRADRGQGSERAARPRGPARSERLARRRSDTADVLGLEAQALGTMPASRSVSALGTPDDDRHDRGTATDLKTARDPADRPTDARHEPLARLGVQASAFGSDGTREAVGARLARRARWCRPSAARPRPRGAGPAPGR